MIYAIISKVCSALLPCCLHQSFFLFLLAQKKSLFQYTLIFLSATKISQRIVNELQQKKAEKFITWQGNDRTWAKGKPGEILHNLEDFLVVFLFFFKDFSTILATRWRSPKLSSFWRIIKLFSLHLLKINDISLHFKRSIFSLQKSH